jgi:TolB-like protein
VPEFELIADDAAESAPLPASTAMSQDVDSLGGTTVVASADTGSPVQRFGRRFWVQTMAAASLVLVLGLLLAGLQLFRAPQQSTADASIPGEPTVFISAITNLSGIPALDMFASRLNDRLSSLLAQFEDVQVGFVEPDRPLDKSMGSFLLSGTVATVGSGIEVTAVLTDAATGSAVWNRNLQEPMPAADDEVVVATAARKIMRELGPFRSPVHAQGRRWLDETTLQIPAVNGYICLLTYRYARETTNPAALAKALDCHERLLAQQPDLPLALAAEAWLEGRFVYDGASPADRMDVVMAEPTALAERAVRLAPESSFAYEQLASLQGWQENYETAQRNYAIALGFEPLNTDARASNAITLARVGDWEQAAEQAQLAIADTPSPSPWYYFLPALIALRDGRLDQAVEQGRKAAQGGEIGAIVALAAAGLAGDERAVADFQPRVMSTESLRRFGVMPWLRIRIKDQAVLERLAKGLSAAGIPASALTAQF